MAFGAKISRNALCDLRLRNPSPAENTPPKKEERVFYVYIWVCGWWVVVAVVVCVCVCGGGLPFSFAHLPPLKRKDTSLLLASSSRMSRSVSCLFEIP